MTVALGILSYFAEHQPKDNLIFFFQPAEESKNGGKLAYDMGAFTGDWHIDEFYGLHDRPDLPAGTISTRLGTLLPAQPKSTLTSSAKAVMLPCHKMPMT